MLLGQKSGCKVGWEFYDNEAEALKASEREVKARERKFKQGFDFGYLSPGAVKHIEAHDEFGDCWIVVTT